MKNKTICLSNFLMLLMCMIFNKSIAQIVWTQKTNFTPGSRSGGYGFSIGNKGYVALGEIGAPPEFNDLWEYAPAGLGINEINTSIGQVCRFYVQGAQDLIVLRFVDT